MSRLDRIDQFDSLPLFGQALLAARMVRRAALAIIPPADPESDMFARVFAAAEACCSAGQDTHRHKSLFDAGMKLRDKRDAHARERAAVRSGLWWMIDATNAAEAALDFPIDSTVTRSARTAIATLAEDPRLNQLQITILLASDIDLLSFACGQSSAASKYAGLGPAVLGGLTPLHPLTLITPN